jgi:hypothetical protein
MLRGNTEDTGWRCHWENGKHNAKPYAINLPNKKTTINGVLH